jgi:hypothetical protein
MEFWQCFTSYKERGEWVELQFMAQAARRPPPLCRLQALGGHEPL